MEHALELINPEGLVKRLNLARSPSEEEIEIRKDCVLSPRSKKVVIKGRFSLIQNFEAIDNPLYLFLSADSESSIGSIYFERGFSEPESNYSPVYEKMRLKIDEPVKMRGGDILPVCEVNLLVEKDEFVESSKYREDYVPRPIIGRKRADLSKILPTECFLF